MSRQGVYGPTLDNRHASRARQRAYRELAKRHAEEFKAILTIQRLEVEGDDEAAPQGRPRKEASA